MRGEDKLQADMFSYLSPESRVRKDHPLRAIRAMADQALDQMSSLFDALYATPRGDLRFLPKSCCVRD